MLTGIAGFEWRYATRRITFAATAAVLALLGYVLAATGFGAQDIHVDSPYAIAYSIGFLSLTSVFALTVLVAPALLRDTEHGMEEIVYTTAVTRTQYLVGRMAGSFAAAASAFLFGIAGMMAGRLAHPPDRLAPFEPAPYLWAFLVFALPSMAFVAALLFTVAAVTRSTLATSIGGVVVYVLYFAAAVVAGSPLLASSGPVSAREMALAALADPFGLSALFAQTHYWTAAERDVRPIALAGRLLANRLLWSAAALALMAVAHRVFAFRVTAPRRRPDDTETIAPTASGPYRAVPVQATTPPAALLSAARLEVRALLRSWPFAAIVILWAGSAFMTVFEELRRAEYGTALVSAAGLMLGHLHQPLSLFGVLVIVYFAGEVVWRERVVHVAEIVDATPAISAIFFAAKTLALCVLVAVMVAVGIAVGLVLQLGSGHPLQPGLLAALFGLDGLPLALFAVLAVLLQTLAPNRHAGLLVTVAAAMFLPLGGPGGPAHPLLRYGFLGDVPYSEMNGFGPAVRVFGWLAVYWTAFAGLLALVAIGAWRRGTDTRLWPRLRGIPRRLGRPARVVAVLCAATFVALGGRLFHQMNVVNAYETTEERLAWKAEYERRYAGVERVPQPRISHVDAAVDLFPAERRYEVRGRYRLENGNAQAVTALTVAVPAGVRVRAMTLDGRGPAREDLRFRTRVFDATLPPGARADLAFTLEVDRSAASADVTNDIVANGSFVFGPSVLPALGYRRAYEIDDPAERHRRGLPEQAKRAPREPELATFDVVVATAPADQTIVAPGVIRESEVRDGRRRMRFASLRPAQPILAFASARYAVATATVEGIAIEVLHHPSHGANVPRILDAARRSLSYCIREYGPYPYPALRIAETPAYDERFGGYALPGVVYLTEDRAFLTDQGDPTRVDIVTKRVAHEVAHQWWGHQVTPPDGPGALAVVETPARYTELMVLKERYGAAALRPVLQVELGRYLSGRRGEAEVPLDQVEGQAYLYYAKGALVTAALADVIGEANVNAALRALVAQANGGGPAPTARDLHAQLRRVTPPAQQAVLDAWWSEVVLYDLRVASARAVALPDGRFRVDARLEGPDAETAVEVAVFAQHPDRSDAPPLAVSGHALRGTADVSVVVDQRPEYVVIDPRLHWIDRNPDDNLRRIEFQAGE